MPTQHLSVELQTVTGFGLVYKLVLWLEVCLFPLKTLIKLDVVVTEIVGRKNVPLNHTLLNIILQPFKAMFYSLRDKILAVVNLLVG